jgi:orotate phosphoribosyltransferase
VEIVKKRNKWFLEQLTEANGYYEGDTLVAYAGKGGDGKNLVGHVYYNCAKLETQPVFLRKTIRLISDDIKNFLFRTTAQCKESFKLAKSVYVVGTPMGGLATGYELASQLKFLTEQQMRARYFYANYVFIEKEILKLKTSETREEFLLKFARHEIPQGSVVIIAEDVINNFTTTKLILDAVKENGSIVIALFCLMNRSDKCNYTYDGVQIPIFSVAHIPTEQWEQSSEKVRDYLALGKKIIMKPKEKESWLFLMEEMNQKKKERTQDAAI